METTREIIEQMYETNTRITRRIIDLVMEQKKMINVLGTMIAELMEEEKDDSA